MSNLINFQKESVVRKQSYTEQQKESAINRYKNRESVIAIAKDFNTSRSTIYYWIKQAERHAIHVTTNSVSVEDYKKLQKKLRRQQLMVEILQIANCSPTAPLTEKLRALAPLYGKYPVHIMCEAFNIARGTYYNHIFKAKSIYIKERQDERKRNNLINRDFHPPMPNQVWAGDTTMIEVKMKKYYICTVMDLFSRKIIDYGISYSENTHLIKSTFEKAVKARSPRKGLVFHSDQGRAYTSNTFTNYLKKLGVEQSFSKKGTPYYNSVAESFNATLKEEELYRYHYHSEQEFRRSVQNYLDYYNNDRPHTTLNHLCPCQYEKINAS